MKKLLSFLFALVTVSAFGQYKPDYSYGRNYIRLGVDSAFKVPELPSDPPFALGNIYKNTVTGKFRFYEAGVWVEKDGGGGGGGIPISISGPITYIGGIIGLDTTSAPSGITTKGRLSKALDSMRALTKTLYENDGLIGYGITRNVSLGNRSQLYLKDSAGAGYFYLAPIYSGIPDEPQSKYLLWEYYSKNYTPYGTYQGYNMLTVDRQGFNIQSEGNTGTDTTGYSSKYTELDLMRGKFSVWADSLIDLTSASRFKVSVTGNQNPYGGVLTWDPITEYVVPSNRISIPATDFFAIQSRDTSNQQKWLYDAGLAAQFNSKSPDAKSRGLSAIGTNRFLTEFNYDDNSGNGSISKLYQETDSSYFSFLINNSAEGFSQQYFLSERSNDRDYLTLGYNGERDTAVNSSQILFDATGVNIGIRSNPNQFATSPSIKGMKINVDGSVIFDSPNWFDISYGASGETYIDESGFYHATNGSGYAAQIRTLPGLVLLQSTAPGSMSANVDVSDGIAQITSQNGTTDEKRIKVTKDSVTISAFNGGETQFKLLDFRLRNLPSTAVSATKWMLVYDTTTRKVEYAAVPTGSGSETDPVFSASEAFNITSTNKTQWTQAYNKYTAYGSYSSGTITFTRNDGTTYTVTGIPTGSSGSTTLNQYQIGVGDWSNSLHGSDSLKFQDGIVRVNDPNTSDNVGLNMYRGATQVGRFEAVAGSNRLYIGTSSDQIKFDFGGLTGATMEQTAFSLTGTLTIGSVPQIWDTTSYKPAVVDGSGNVKKGYWFPSSSGGGLSGLTAGQVAFATSGTTIGGDSHFTWDATNREIGIPSTFGDFKGALVFGGYSSIGATKADAGFVMGTGVKPGTSTGTLDIIGSNANWILVRYDRGISFHTGLASSGTVSNEANERAIFDLSGDFTINSLAGTGTRMVVASASGKLSTQSIPSGGVSDGDKGDITVASSGTAWSIDNLAVTDAKINDLSISKLTGTTLTQSSISFSTANSGTLSLGQASATTNIFGSDLTISITGATTFSSGGGVTFTDNQFILADGTVSSKKLQFELSGISSSTTRVATFPDADITVVGTSNTQTLSNKSISLGSNTVTTTLAQLNTAVSDDDVLGAVATQTVTNKTIASATNAVEGTLIAVRTFTSGTTYTPSSGTTKIFVQLLGAGGGGGGSAGVASGSGAGAGGGAGAYVEKFITGISSATTYTIAIGTGGTAGAAASSGTGGTGGSTTFTTAAGSTPASTTITAAGGIGGGGQAGVTTASATSPAIGGTGGGGTNGDVNGAGKPGDYGIHLLAALSISGAGAESIFGGGGKSVVGTTSGSAGNNGAGYGSGGGGAASGGNTNVAGGIGAGGIMIIYEYK